MEMPIQIITEKKISINTGFNFEVWFYIIFTAERKINGGYAKSFTCNSAQIFFSS